MLSTCGQRLLIFFHPFFICFQQGDLKLKTLSLHILPFPGAERQLFQHDHLLMLSAIAP